MFEVQAAPVDAASLGCNVPNTSWAEAPSNRRLMLPGCRALPAGPFETTGPEREATRLTKVLRCRATLLRSSAPLGPEDVHRSCHPYGERHWNGPRP